MLTGTIRNDIDKLWEKFWTGGITNPLTVIEQISYLMFARMLDMQEEATEAKNKRIKQKMPLLFPQTDDGQLMRWKNLKNLNGKDLHSQLKNHLFPFFATLGDQTEEDDDQPPSAFAHIGEYMQDADLEIKNESVLVAAVEMVDKLPLADGDVKGDIYEYLLSKLTTAGINGQFRTPRHIIDAIIALADPQTTDVICDPACGTAGFLARTREHLNRVHSSEAGIFEDEDGNKQYTGDLLNDDLEHINNSMFWGFDFDTTMLRVSSMNMLLHGVTSANIEYQDSLNKSVKHHYPEQEEDFFDLVLANPPFKGSLDASNVNPDVINMVKTKKTELLFVAHILRCLKTGGRAAVIVPDGVLFGSSKAHQQLRKTLIENNQLDAIVSLPSGVFKPYAGVSTAILLFTKGGTTDQVWFYDLQADGYSLDDKRNPIEDNDIPDLLKQYSAYRKLRQAAAKEYSDWEDKTQPAFIIDAADIKANKYDFSINRYKKVVYEEDVYEDPKVILKQLMELEDSIQKELKELEGML